MVRATRLGGVRRTADVRSTKVAVPARLDQPSDQRGRRARERGAGFARLLALRRRRPPSRRSPLRREARSSHPLSATDLA
jgi:hypothetical protein